MKTCKNVMMAFAFGMLALSANAMEDGMGKMDKMDKMEAPMANDISGTQGGMMMKDEMSDNGMGMKKDSMHKDGMKKNKMSGDGMKMDKMRK